MNFSSNHDIISGYVVLMSISVQETCCAWAQFLEKCLSPQMSSNAENISRNLIENLVDIRFFI